VAAFVERVHLRCQTPQKNQDWWASRSGGGDIGGDVFRFFFFLLVPNRSSPGTVQYYTVAMSADTIAAWYLLGRVFMCFRFLNMECLLMGCDPTIPPVNPPYGYGLGQGHQSQPVPYPQTPVGCTCTGLQTHDIPYFVVSSSCIHLHFPCIVQAHD